MGKICGAFYGSNGNFRNIINNVNSSRFFAYLVVFGVLIGSSASANTVYNVFNDTSSGVDFVTNSNVNGNEGGDPILKELVASTDDVPPRLRWFSRLFNHHEFISKHFRHVNSECRKNMFVYLSALNNGTTWAAKMNDASGKYAGQFYFGNDFWLGSSDLCRELQKTKYNTNVPPFRVHFNIVKVLVNINHELTPTSRQISVGQCIPSSCKIPDITSFLTTSSHDISRKAHGSSIKIMAVRPVPGDYILLNDYKFHIIGGVGLSLVILMVIATAYEYVLKFRFRQKINRDIEFQNTNNNNVDAKHSERVTDSTSKIIDKSMQFEKQISNNTGKGTASKLLLCFSMVSNGKKILAVDATSKETIKCVHGLRFLSLAWVIMVHTYLEVFAIAENKTLRTVTERFYWYQTISNATFSVDTFFFISGLLLTILYFRSSKKATQSSQSELQKPARKVLQENTQKFFVLVLYRFLRLTPAYLFVLGVNEIVLRYYHNTSVFEPGIIDHITCDKYWWRNALYINTLFPQSEICMLWSWYMSNDTQFYVIGVVLLLVAVRSDRHLKFAAGALLIFVVSSWVTTFSIAVKYNYVARIEEPFALFDQLYDKPWTRIGPYLVGMSTGYVLFKMDGRLKLSPAIAAVAWIASLSVMISLVYGLGRDGLVVPLSAFYQALGHTAWGLSLSWIVIACCTGYAGPVDSLLGFRGFLPLSRLAYCAYLVHPMIMCITSFQMDGPIHLHNGIVMVIYFGNVVVSYLMSFAISMALEAPVVRVLKIVLGGSKDD